MFKKFNAEFEKLNNISQSIICKNCLNESNRLLKIELKNQKDIIDQLINENLEYKNINDLLKERLKELTEKERFL